MPEPSRPVHSIEILVLPNFSHLTLAAVIEPMRVANKVTRRPLFEWKLVGVGSGLVPGSSGVMLQVDADVMSGQRGDALLVVASFDVDQHITRPLKRVLRDAARRGCLLGGFETGAYVLAAAGVLDGYRATTHWEDLEDFRARYARVDVRPDRFVVDRGRLSTGGALPTLDLMLDLIQRDHGLALAITVSGVFIYDQDRSAGSPQHAVSVSRLAYRDRKLANAIALMEEGIESPLEIEDIAVRVGIGARELQRRFRARLGTSPLRFFNEMRLSLAYRLLEHTDRTVADIAIATGFGSGSAFARAFRARFGRTPTSLRR